MHYDDFFKVATGFEPFPYQSKFGQAEPANAKLLIPTGGAKTLTVLIRWLWRHYEGLPVSTRLVVVEPMRVLVGQVISECDRAVAAAGLDIPVHRLMGGDVDNSWIDYPERPAIIVGTQDQILSRGLMRGYASSRWAWPKHFALLHNDCEYFIDEVQLMGPGYSTSAWMAALREEQQTFGPCPVTWASATLDPTPLERAVLKLQSWELGACDRSHSVLGQRIGRLKRLSKAKTELGRDLDAFASQLAAEVLSNHEDGTLSLVILSQVDRALEVYRALQKKGVSTRLLHSRFRRADRAKLTDGLLGFRGILVSTQVVEAGMDLDARRLYTDLSSWASFVQRAGRCGRRGTYGDADIYWIDCDLITLGNALPYAIADCEFTGATLQALPDASISTLLAVEPPAQDTLGPVLTEAHLQELFDTYPTPDYRDTDIAPYIRDSGSLNCSVAWFAGDTPTGDWMSVEDELCPVPLGKLRDFTGEAWAWNAFDEEWGVVKTADLRSGATVGISQSAGGYSTLLGWSGNPADIPTIPEATGQHEAYSEDRDTARYLFVSLAQHSVDVRGEMARIMKKLSFELPGDLSDMAQWHDLGKAHWAFQDAMGTPDPVGAKGRFVRRGYQRRGFRHELASALAALHHGKPFYFAYLVAAHHGKARTTIEPMRYEEGTYRGVEPGEKLPVVNLGDGVLVAESSLDIPDGDAIGWWKEQVFELIDQVGVFRLAYLEALIRAADAQASAKY